MCITFDICIIRKCVINVDKIVTTNLCLNLENCSKYNIMVRLYVILVCLFLAIKEFKKLNQFIYSISQHNTLSFNGNRYRVKTFFILNEDIQIAHKINISHCD